MGKEGQTWKIRPVLTGRFGMVRDDIKFEGGDPKTADYVPSVLFLLENDGEQVVVDTGFGDPARCREALNLLVEREEPYEELLLKAGIRSDKVMHVILTHLHWDHAGNCQSFPSAGFYVQEAEWERARLHPEEYPREWLTFLFDNRERVKLLTGEEPILPGIRAVYTGGHTYGSQMVLVDTAEGLGVITGDVVMTFRNYQEGIPVGLCVNKEECRRALEIIREREPEVLYPSHDFQIF